jgi:hypothetical protein
MPAQQVGAQLRLERRPAEVFDRAWLAIGPVVEQAVDIAVTHGQGFVGRRRDRLGSVQVQFDRLQAGVAQRRNILGLCARWR